MVKDPFFWTSIALVTINFLLYYINKKTFKILYEKPKIWIRDIQGTEKENKHNSHIDIYISNPSSFDNRIINYNIKCLFCRTIIDQGPLDFQLPSAYKMDYDFPINNEKTKQYKGKFIVFTLFDIKGSKSKTLFRFSNTT